MNAILKSPFAWLLKREYWESRRPFLWTQIIAAATILVVTVLGIVVGEVLRVRSGDSVELGTGFTLGEALRRASAEHPQEIVQALDVTLLLFASIAMVILFFVVFFYLLGALYDDRRDRSVLFWKSLPVSDTATVVSKVITATIVAPLLAVGVALLGYLGLQIIVSLWMLVHGANPFPLLWAHAEPFALWLRLLVMVPVNAIWALPTVGWLLVWSAAVRSKPFLWAVAIPIVAGLLNLWLGLLGLPNIPNSFFYADLVGRALLGVFPGGWAGIEAVRMSAEPGAAGFQGALATMGYPAMARAFAMPQMWIGAIVGIALIAAAIWFRRWRDEA